MQKSLKMTETLAHGYSSQSTWHELSNEYPHDSVSMVFKNLFRLCALDKSSLSIRRVELLLCYRDMFECVRSFSFYSITFFVYLCVRSCVYFSKWIQVKIIEVQLSSINQESPVIGAMEAK